MADRATDEELENSGAGSDARDEDVVAMEAAQLARLRASRALTMSQRLARTHELCAQLSTLRPITPRFR
jgi:hypothetical protein